MGKTGITSYGGYIPRYRLQREAVVKANGWFNPALKAYAKAERAICNWDEDSLTMGVEAARNCLFNQERTDIQTVMLASTTLPFQDRNNAGVLANALMLGEEVATLDITSSQRAGTSGLINAVSTAQGGNKILLVASDHRPTRSATVQELLFGDGAAALTLGNDNLIAELLGSQSVTVDFVDHYRGENQAFDYNWEERWIRDEGYMKIVPKAVEAVLEKTGLTGGEITHFILPCLIRNVARNLAKKFSISEEAIADNLHSVCGETGAAHPLVMLVKALETAQPGDKLLVVGFGQGCDALVFEVTPAIESFRPHPGISPSLARKAEETNYNKFLAFNNLVNSEKGMRAETDNQTALTTLYRKKDMLTGLIGGRCTQCDTKQFPKSNVCVNPECNARHTQEDYPFADKRGKILTWSADFLTYSIDPPTHYGMVEFEGGGRFLANFADVDPGSVDTGMEMQMMFRIKEFDNQRGFRKYFWKAAPATQ